MPALTKFTDAFPNCMITQALELTHETTIPLDNSEVTPESLQALNKFIEQKFILSELFEMGAKHETSFDYLCITINYLSYLPGNKPVSFETESLTQLSKLHSLRKYHKPLLEYAIITDDLNFYSCLIKLGIDDTEYRGMFYWLSLGLGHHKFVERFKIQS